MNETYNTPAILSLFAPGFGQLAKKHWVKSISIMIVFFLLVLNLKFRWVFDGEHLLFVTGCIYFILTAFSVYDAYNSESDWD